MNPGRIVLAPGVFQEIIRHARSCLPEESCGFLVGWEGRIERFIPAKNALASKTAFSVEPRFLFKLFRELRASGETLVAIYHSHPTGEAIPSPRDVREAYYPNSAHVIVSLQDETQPEVRAFRVIEDDVIEIGLHAIV